MTFYHHRVDRELSTIAMNGCSFREHTFFERLLSPNPEPRCWEKIVDSLYNTSKYLTLSGILYIYKSQITSIMEYCCHILFLIILPQVGQYGLELDRVQKRLRGHVGNEIYPLPLQTISHRQNLYRYFHVNCSDEIHFLVPQSSNLHGQDSRCHADCSELPSFPVEQLLFTNSYFVETTSKRIPP